jgi:small-conductance mechanosensitive channel
MTQLLAIKIPASPWVLLPLVVVVAAIAAYLLNLTALWLLDRVAKRRNAEFDERMRHSIERYLFPVLFVAGLLLILDVAPLPPKVLRAAHRVLALSGLVLALFLIGKVALQLLRNMEGRHNALANIRAPIELVAKIVFAAVGGMIILDNLGISLTPILTTLGIGSLAVAIALQDTLGNFFAGLYIKADRPIEVGQFVRLESGEEGYVDWIGWRSTRIRMLPNNTVVVPNSKLVQSNITNYYLPERELAVLVQLGVHYDSDLEKVERVTIEVGREIMQTVPGGVPGFEPFIRYHTFNESSIDFTVILRAREFVDNFLVKHEFVKRLQQRYQREGIVIPFPIRTVHLKSESKSDA